MRFVSLQESELKRSQEFGLEAVLKRNIQTHGYISPANTNLCNRLVKN